MLARMSNPTLELLRAALLRAAPLSMEERDAFLLYSGQLRRQLNAIEEVLETAGKSTDAVKTLRYLLEALPCITV